MTSAPLAATPPSLSARFAESGAVMWQAAAVGAAEYWLGALRRGAASPWHVAADAVNWLHAAATHREGPRWHSPHEIVLEGPVARLRDFTAGAGADVAPTLVLPPQAGHDSCIVDYSPRQSQIRAIRAAGLVRTFSLDWIGATPETRDTTVDDYLAFIERSIAHIGEPVNLVGDCQGGWLATIYAALRPDDVLSLTIAGAPIDFHAGDAVIRDWVRCLTTADLAFYRWVVQQGGGVLKGEHVRNGFILLKPENELSKHIQLLAHLHEPDFVERHRAFETWFTHVQDVPGAFYLWIAEHLFVRNALVAGELEIGGERVDLARITCPVNLLAGAKDHLTPAAQVFAAADHVGTPAADIVKRTTSGGHLGLFMGTEALRDHWPALMTAVAARYAPRRRSPAATNAS
jgi:poly(3-hydroxyalkanoate) synthetase